VILTKPPVPRPFLETPPIHFAGFPSVITFCIPDKTEAKFPCSAPHQSLPFSALRAALRAVALSHARLRTGVCKGRCPEGAEGAAYHRTPCPIVGRPAAQSASPPSDEGGGICGANDGGREKKVLPCFVSPPVTFGDSPLVRGGQGTAFRCPLPSFSLLTSNRIYGIILRGQIRQKKCLCGSAGTPAAAGVRSATARSAALSAS